MTKLDINKPTDKSNLFLNKKFFIFFYLVEIKELHAPLTN